MSQKLLSPARMAAYTTETSVNAVVTKFAGFFNSSLASMKERGRQAYVDGSEVKAE